MASSSESTQSLVVGTLLLALGAAIVEPVLSPREVLEAAVSVLDATSSRGPSASHHSTHPPHVPGSRAVASTSGAVIDLVSVAPSGTDTSFYVAVPMTEVGTYVSDQIVDDIKFAARPKHGQIVDDIKFAAKPRQPWVPPTVRHYQRR